MIPTSATLLRQLSSTLVNALVPALPEAEHRRQLRAACATIDRIASMVHLEVATIEADTDDMAQTLATLPALVHGAVRASLTELVHIAADETEEARLSAFDERNRALQELIERAHKMLRAAVPAQHPARVAIDELLARSLGRRALLSPPRLTVAKSSRI